MQHTGSKQVGLFNKQHRDTYRGVDGAEFRLADKDRNGKLTAKEMVHFVMEKLDTDGDSRLSFKEKHWDADVERNLPYHFDKYFWEERPASRHCP